VLTYCVLSNHFHILVEVPERPKELPGSEELLEKLGWEVLRTFLAS
jgi:REP element-mobilizing transposase RayT